ncbi:MAG: zinc ribbon domain-containing protein [Caldilineaceae bacterium]
MPSDLFNSIATVVGVVVAVLGAFFFAFWIAMGIWAFNDIRSRSRDWLAIVLACLLVLIFPVVGLILYLMIRPKHTLAEVYDRALEEEALLREIEETVACITCGIPVQETWVYCPNCHHQLQHSCVNCKNLVRNEWEICVYCGTNQQTRTAGQTAASRAGQAAPATAGLFNRRAGVAAASPVTENATGSPTPISATGTMAQTAARERDDTIYRPVQVSE